MNSSRYKTLLSYLPGMAAVVNMFDSEQVQIAVFDRLISALDEKTEQAPASTSKSRSKKAASNDDSEIEIEHDLIEGESIHALADLDD